MPVYSIDRKFPDSSGDSIQLSAEGDPMTMTDNTPRKSAKKPHWTSLEIGLTTVVSLFFIVIMALVILYATQRTEEICTTADCTQSAARLLQNMDTSTDPCDNFYQYACGGWLKKNLIPDTSSRYGTFDVLREELQVILKGVLEKTVEGEAEALAKAKTLYKSCVNESLIEKRGGLPLLNMLPDVFEWPMAVDNWDTDYGATWRLEDVIAKLNVKYRRELLVVMFVSTDDKDSKSHIIHFDQQSSLGLWTRSHYACNGSYEEACQAYEQFMFDLVKLIRTDRGLSFNETLVKEEMTRVTDLERDIANAIESIEYRSDPKLRYHKMELGDMNTNFTLEVESQVFNWSYFVAKIMNTVNVTVTDTEKVINFCPEYYRGLKLILAKYTKRDLQNYLVWRVAMNMVMRLSTAYRDTEKVFRKVLYGVTSEAVAWRFCTVYVNSNMDNAVGRLYVQEAFSKNSKKLMEEMINEIQEVFIRNLHELTWMDPDTKKAAEQKARAIKEQIGYSEDIMDDKYLNDEYKDLHYSEEEFFENSLRIMEYMQRKRLEKLREKVNKDEWVSGAAVINAFYSSRINHIVFPAGILQPPFFSQGQAKSLNYGGIGAVIGHEITHGFDNTGKKYDENGDLRDWWTPDSAQNFLELSRCIVDQYSNFTWDLLNGLHLNGNLTLGENIADNGGIRQAYQAYKNYVRKHGEEPRLPGMNLSHDQLFFLNFAQVWCGTQRPEDAKNSMESEHSPGQFRVLGSLQNFPEFAKAFSCNKSSYMVPDNVCQLW
ncbi:neprilysin-like isoform X1 [Nerophis ophidion]|uniref:neprilysin-like isoform X1 n=1 Tax=Nerophis ophidion TaxID=159077 RepID=UPI002ADF176A|nr:neprilysin-like isoform X1 [Nerophis ophidion]